MKKIFVLALLLSVIFTNLVLPCEKAFAEGEVTYWICGECGQKAKTLKGWIPKREMYDRNYFGGRIPVHYHLWKEVDYRTWITW